VLVKVAERNNASPARVALAWMLTRPAISSIIIAGRTLEQLDDNIRAADLELSADDLKALNDISDPGTPYPKWMVLQLDQAEDPRPRTLEPERFADGGPWRDMRKGKG
jgi:diketogulonate reductase-like aldo/keto reductase